MGVMFGLNENVLLNNSEILIHHEFICLGLKLSQVYNPLLFTVNTRNLFYNEKGKKKRGVGESSSYGSWKPVCPPVNGIFVLCLAF